MPIRHSASFLQTFHTAQTAAQRTAESQTATPTDHMDVDPAALAFVKSGGAAPVIKTAPRAELPNLEVKVWDRAERRERVYHVAEGAQFASAKQAKWMLSIAINQVIPAGATLESLLIRLQQGFARHAASQFITNYKDLPMREVPVQVTIQTVAPAVTVDPGKTTGVAVTPQSTQVPAGRYAVADPADGVIKFYKLDRPTEGRWAGYVFLKLQASDEMWPIKNPIKRDAILVEIAKDVKGFEQAYGQLLGKCARCGRTLTDETSRAYGIGPECRKK